MKGEQQRIARERKTVELMIDLYCRKQHGSNGPSCAECEALRDYARQRLDKCLFQAGKTTCAQCPVHCYRPKQRASIRAVMRYAGPRMQLRHPVLVLLHLTDGLRKEPIRPQRKHSGRASREPLEEA